MWKGFVEIFINVLSKAENLNISCFKETVTNGMGI